MDPRQLLAGMTEANDPSRHWVSGIQAGFVSDGYLPLPGTTGASSQTCRYDKEEMEPRYQPAGMTKPKGIFIPDLGMYFLVYSPGSLGD
jgi:hypothetical protein